MTPELWTIVGVGVALAGLMLSGQQRIGARMDRDKADLIARMDRDKDELIARMDRDKAELIARMDRDKAELIARMDRLESQIGDLRERTAHSDGLLEGLREAVTRERAA